MAKWTTLLTTPEPASVPVSVPVSEIPVTVAPTAPPVTRQEPSEPQVPEASEFEIDAMLTANGATSKEIWCVKESFKEKGITPDTTLAWLWLNKLRLRERL